nr:hypothetical protein [Tanacetum cinerariifolium]
MANLTSKDVNEVHSDDNHIFDNVNHQLAQEMHQEEHLGFDDEYDFLTNTILYKKLNLFSDTENVSTEASAATSDQIAMIAILNNLTSQQEIGRLDTQKIKLDLENQVRQEQGLVIQRNQRNAELLKENELLKSTLSAKDKVTKEMLQRFNMPTHTIPMLSKKPRRATADLHQDILDSSDCMLAELRTNCDREHSKVLELEAEVLKKQHMLTESEKR